ncbi:MAG: FadD3 family acyl-CoA ligase [Gammaproteobacteria bacterium]|nr:FadD3 family acyl-CoA ligase [Gammaproteobacteria bacterium]MDH3371904.1 FadD3 family acyl-CoA ligase [Gammaproteobacteria bacterium]MDH3551114.1 FadD3 family acyl-CoA ligase [Gammaproteobacteria bacterium]
MNRTIPEVALAAADRWPDRPAVIDGDIELTFAQLGLHAERAARAFIASGLEPGERFAIWAPNLHEWIWTAIGGQMAGGVLVPINTRYKGAEAGDILRRARCRILLTVCGFLDTDYPSLLHDQDLPDLETTILLRGQYTECLSLADFIAAGDDIDPAGLDTRRQMLRADGLSDLMYTSGTTGAPKGVMSTHGQVVAIFDTWSRAVGLGDDDRYLIVNPFFHTFGYKSGWLTCLLTGATCYPEAVFDAGRLLERIERDRITMLPGAPTVFQALLAHENLATTDTSSLRCAVTGAASVPVQLVRDMKQVLGFDRVYTGYGLTECGVVSICRAGDDFETIANTAGRPIEDIEVRVVNDDEEQVKPGETGHIKVRGFNVMQGYFDDPDATSAAISDDGWLDTGDIGWQDKDGYLKITDRAKDMYICGGFNCYPAEIENLLLGHPDIADVAVIGRADERLGEVGHAFVVANADGGLTAEEVIAWAREKMANFKVPRRVSFVDALPRNASGKVQKFLLCDD